MIRTQGDMSNTKKIIEVNSLSEYISCIHTNKLNNYISRGENKKYSNITASAFRNDLPIKFQNMISAFYDAIGNNITNMQRDNFVAFSQHHGIPTNLIDFSTSPLVSLFFACYGENQSGSGYVYFINNNKLININEIVPHTNYQNNLFKDLLQFDSSIQPLITKLYTYEHTHIKEMVDLVVAWSNKLKLEPNVKKNIKKPC